MRRIFWISALVVAAVVAAAVSFADNSYTVRLVIPSAAQLSKKSPVWIDGRTVGQISDLGVRNGQALVTLSLDPSVAPLHDGTTSRVEWVSAIGERVLTLYPGPSSNVALPSGAIFSAQSSQVEVDQVLAALDTPTRQKLSSLLGELQGTLAGHETDVQSTIQGASSAIAALGEVLRGVGQDGPAIHSLVTQLSSLTQMAASRSGKIASTVSQLDQLTASVAQQQSQLGSTLGQLPGLLSTAQTTLDKVPSASSATVDLLDSLQPSTKQLPHLASNLAPTLVDLRPTVAQLKPLLAAASQMLGETPGLLDQTHGVVPGLTTFLQSMGPVVNFLRPYAPEGIGGLANWGQAFAPYDGAGHTWAGLLAPGANAFNETPVPLPTSRQNAAPAPGSDVGQPWTDAAGSGIQ